MTLTKMLSTRRYGTTYASCFYISERDLYSTERPMKKLDCLWTAHTFTPYVHWIPSYPSTNCS